MSRFGVAFFIMVIWLAQADGLYGQDNLPEEAASEQVRMRIEALESEIRDIKKRIREGKAPSLETAEDVAFIAEDVEEISERLDVVEKRSILDRIQFSGEFRNILEYYDIDNLPVNGEERDGAIDELWSSRLRLNLYSQITQDIIFQGRLSYLKYWGDANYSHEPRDWEYNAAPDSEGDLHVERAYIDYFVPGTPMALTFGRLPVSGGPPYGFKNNTTRKATWPQLFVEGEFDGIIGSLGLESWTGLEDGVFRLGYCKATQNYLQYQNVKMNDLRVYFITLESEIPGIKDSILWMGAYKGMNVTPLDLIPDTTYPEDSGHYENYTMHLQVDDILGSGLGWFGAFGYQRSHPRNEGTEVLPGVEIGYLGDSLHNDLGKRRTAYSIYTGLKYVLPLEILKNPQVGFEYNYGSQYWVPASISKEDLTHKLGVLGHAYELYYLQPVHEKHMFLRIGSIYEDYEYYSPYWIYGSREDAQTGLNILKSYFLVDVRF